MKRTVLCLLLLFAKVALAQTTSVTLQVTDTTSQTWNNGMYSAVLTPSPGSGPVQFLLSGVVMTGSQITVTGVLDGTGSATFPLSQNNAISPINTYWTITVCPQATASCFKGTASVSGASQNVTITPPPIVVTLANPPYTAAAYADSEVTGVVVGSNYFNVTNSVQRVCTVVDGSNCTTWVNSGGGGGGGITPPAGDIGGSTATPTVVSTHLSSPLPKNQGGTGTATPGDVQGSNITITGTWPNQTISASAGVITNDPAFSGPNPYLDIRAYGGRYLGNFAPGIPGVTATIANGSITATVSSSTAFYNGDPVVILGPGPAHSMSTPAAPTVTASIASNMLMTGYDVAAPAGGSNTLCYKLVAIDKNRGYTAASAEACVTGQAPGLVSGVAVTGSACSQSGKTVTCQTTGAHGLSVGAMVIPTGTTYYNVATVPDTTHFTFKTSTDTTYGASTSPSMASFNYWRDNHVGLPAFTAGVWQYAIYVGASNAETFYALSLPVAAAQDDGTNLIWQDFGPETSQLPAGSTPYGLPTSAPSTPGADELLATVTAGGQTGTLTLSTSTNNAACAGGGCIIMYDAGGAIQAAQTYATAHGGTLYVPTVPTVGFYYNINSPVTLTSDIMFSGGADITAPFQTSGRIIGNFLTNLASKVRPSFSNEPLTGLSIHHASPGIISSGTINGVSISSPSNGIAVLTSGSTGGLLLYEHDTFFGTGAAGIGFYEFASRASGSFGLSFTDVSFLSDQGASTPQVPVFISKNYGIFSFKGLSSSRRGYWFAPPPFGGLDLTMDIVGDFQGNIMPEYTTTVPGAGGGLGGTIDFHGIQEDTSTQPVYANLDSYPGGHFVGTLVVDGAPTFTLSGYAPATMDMSGVFQSCNSSTVPNLVCRNNYTNTDYHNNNMAIAGPYNTVTVSNKNVSVANPTFYDNFTRADGVLAGVAGTGICNTYAYYDPTKTFSISSDLLVATTQPSNAFAWCSAPVLPLFNGQFAEATLTGFSGTDVDGAIAFASGSVATGMYGYFAGEGNGHFYCGLQAVNSYNPTQYGSTSITPLAGDVVRVEATYCPTCNAGNPENFITCKATRADGTQLTLSGTETTWTFASGSPGVFTCGGNAGTSLTNFSGGMVHPQLQPDIEQNITQPQHFLSPIYASAVGTTVNCSVNTTSPAACGSAASGAFVIPTTTTTYTVNTTAVTSHSRILLQPMTFASDLPGTPTCVVPLLTTGYSISAISPGASFTMALSSTTGQTCWSYWIVD